MLHRSLTAVVVASAVLALAPLAAAAQTAESAAPRTPWGAPDLQGVWDFRSLTPLERPEELGEKAFLTAEEAAALEQEAVQRNEELLNRPAESASAGGSVDVRDDGSPGFYNNFWLDGGTSTVDSRRTSLITDPPNGRIPPMTTAAAKRAAALAMERRGTATHEPTPGGWIHDLGPMGLQLRCITGFNSGPPITPGFYNQNVQIFQTPDEVVLLNEMNHNFRVVPLDGSETPGLAQWTGILARALGQRYARGRNEGFPPGDELCLWRNHQASGRHRAIYPRIAGHAALPGHRRRSDRVAAALVLRAPDEVE